MPLPAGRTGCDHCGKPLANRKYKYHAECRELVAAAAQHAPKRCKRCRVDKPAESFSNDSTRPEGKFPWCMECQGKYMQASRWQNPEDQLTGRVCPLCDTPLRGRSNRMFCSDSCKGRVKSLREKFGLTVQQYRQMVSATEGHCPLCDRRVRIWHVDHNHETGEITGVVCGSCNVGPIAHTYHDIDFVKKLLSYLENPPAARLGVEARAPEGPARPSNLHMVWGRARQQRPSESAS